MAGKRLLGICFLMLLAMASSVNAGQAEDATSLVNGAVTLFKESGREAALKAINMKNGPFVKGELYVFAITMDNVIIGHPHEHSLRRVNVSNTKDANGVPLFLRFKEVVEKDGSGWVEYMWAKPGEKDPSPKRSFVMKVPGEDLYVGAGYYVPSGPGARAGAGQ